MPVTYRIDTSEECVYVDFEGVVTDADLLDIQQAMFRDPLFKGHYTRLIDATHATDLQVTPKVVQSLAVAAIQRGFRRAALVANSNFDFAMMRMYEGYASGAECHVFRNRTEALAWLFRKAES